jgi:hypothetical protein
MRYHLLALLCLITVAVVGCKTEPPRATQPTRMDDTKPTRGQ